jgi:hypothetical protein
MMAHLGAVGELLVLLPLALLCGWAPFLTLLFMAGWALAELGASLPGLLPQLGKLPFVLGFTVLYVGNLLLQRPHTLRLPFSLLLSVGAPMMAVLTVAVALGSPGWHPVAWLLLMAVVAALATWAQMTRSGIRLLPALRGRGRPSPTLIHLAEDSLVLGALVLWAEGSSATALVEGLLLAGIIFLARPAFRLQHLAPHLLRGGLRLLYQTPSWRPWQELPEWVREGGSRELPTDHQELRGGPAALVGNEAIGGIRTGWLLPGPGHLLFLFRRRGRSWAVDLNSHLLSEEFQGPYARILLLPGLDSGSPWRLVVPRDLPLAGSEPRNPEPPDG